MSAQDDEQRKWAEQEANKIYEQMTSIGQGDLAKQLKSMNLSQISAYQDRLREETKRKAQEKAENITGKTQFRPAMLGQAQSKYGNVLSDKDITYDESTGTINVKGYNIGKPEYLDKDAGVSYYSPEQINKTLETLADIYGWSKSGEAIYQDSSKKTDRYFDNYEKYITSNPFDTPEAKFLLEMGKEQGEKYGSGYLAAGAGQNAGNIDSHSIALSEKAKKEAQNNALMQALNAYNIKGQHHSNIIDKAMGWTDSNYAKMQDIKNQELNRQGMLTNITGQVAPQTAIQYNPFYNRNTGQVADIDYQSLINDIDTQITQTKDETEKIKLQAQKEILNEARNYKIMSNPELMKKYGHTISLDVPAYLSAATQDALRKAQLEQDKLASEENKWQTELAAKVGMNTQDNITRENISILDNKTELNKTLLSQANKQPTSYERYEDAMQTLENPPEGENPYYWKLNEFAKNPVRYTKDLGTEAAKLFVRSVAGQIANIEGVSLYSVLKRVGLEAFATNTDTVEDIKDN